MDSFRVVVVDVFSEQPSQVVFVEDHYVIEWYSANAADNTIGGSVLPPRDLSLAVYPNTTYSDLEVSSLLFPILGSRR